MQDCFEGDTFEHLFMPAYPNIEDAVFDCEQVRDYFKKEYEVEEQDIHIYQNATNEKLVNAYDELKAELRTDKAKTLVFHVMSGHALHNEETAEGTLFTNEWDKKSQNYKRFPGERMVKELADSCPNSYHIGLFIYCRGLETNVLERTWYSRREAEEIYKKKNL